MESRDFVLGPHQRIDVLARLDVPDVARWGSCSRATHLDIIGTMGEVLWNSVYDTTQRLNHPASAEVRALVARPCGNAAVTHRVAVYSAARDEYLGGTVQAFDITRNAYLVSYDEAPEEDGEVEIWEVDARRDFAVFQNPNLQSQSRLRFFTLPSDADCAPSSPHSGNNSGALQAALFARGGQDLLRLGSWRQELRHTASNTPSVRKLTIHDHTDEVLFVVFSPDGHRLATCSRDRRTGVYEFDERHEPSRTCVLEHRSTVLRAQWWPEAPHRRLTVSIGGPNEQALAEVWDVEEGVRLVSVDSHPFDIYAAVIRWPARTGPYALLAGGAHHFISDGCQQLHVWELPPMSDTACQSQPRRLCDLRLPLVVSPSYCHCPEPAPPGKFDGWVAALTGTSGTLQYQCNAIMLFELPAEPPEGEPVRVEMHMHTLHGRAVLSVKWSRDGELLILNTRPHLDDSCSSLPAPPLSTAVELMVLDGGTRETLSIHGGHYAFTTAEAPFILHTDIWADGDILASGGEDRCVHVWHRRHRRQLQRLEGHGEAVNAVSWSESHRLLASASDDHMVILWS